MDNVDLWPHECVLLVPRKGIFQIKSIKSMPCPTREPLQYNEYNACLIEKSIEILIFFLIDRLFDNQLIFR